jgi:predicted secreted hydrolase
MKPLRTALGPGLLAAIALAAAWLWLRPAPGGAGARLALAPGPGTAGFARALAPRAFRLPDDHGPHFEFQTEWWYYTGQLESDDGRRFGFQLTFFRRGLTPGAPPDGAGLATNQIHFAHFALTDVAARRHRFFERFARGAGGLAGARGAPFAVWLEDWRAEGENHDASRVRLGAAADGIALDLTLAARKPLIAHGERGLSAKSAQPGNASYYVGYTRMDAAGHLATGGATRPVRGQAWFDHEWSTSALGAGVQGWDWFSLQLDDGRELMFYGLRREDGTLEPASAGTLVERDGAARPLGPGDVRVQALAHWTSPETRARYPTRWRLRVPSASLTLDVAALLDAQEMRTSFTYWEGAVGAAGTAADRPVTGRGYVELTGYAESLRGVF